MKGQAKDVPDHPKTIPGTAYGLWSEIMWRSFSHGMFKPSEAC